MSDQEVLQRCLAWLFHFYTLSFNSLHLTVFLYFDLSRGIALLYKWHYIFLVSEFWLQFSRILLSPRHVGSKKYFSFISVVRHISLIFCIQGPQTVLKQTNSNSYTRWIGLPNVANSRAVSQESWVVRCSPCAPRFSQINFQIPSVSTFVTPKLVTTRIFHCLLHLRVF